MDIKGPCPIICPVEFEFPATNMLLNIHLFNVSIKLLIGAKTGNTVINSLDMVPNYTELTV